MKRKHNEGFTLLETLIAIVVLGIVVVPTCSALLMSFRMNAKTDQLLQDQLAVSSAVETLMSEGITEQKDGYGVTDEGDRFPGVHVITVSKGTYYEVTVVADDGEARVTTYIRAAETPPAESQPGGGS